MPYSDFTLEKVEADFGLSTRIEDIFPALQPLPVSESLASWLDRGRRIMSLSSEKARSEVIVTPILLEAQQYATGFLSIFSGQRLDIDQGRGLVGECDFIMAQTQPIPRLKAPLFMIVEAKRGDIELGLGQCAAQMVGARMFNERAATGGRSIFGCVTSGEDWQFLKLTGDEILYDSRRLYLNDLGSILAVLKAIVTSFPTS